VHVHRHNHGHHHHHHGGSANVLKWSFAATVLFVVIQFAAGLRSGSLALISDAGHNLTDALALALAMFGVYLQGNRPTSRGRSVIIAAVCWRHS
jgi:cobalt-zinc-cadmium efflux system protein